MLDASHDRERLAEIDPALGRGTRIPLALVLLGVVLAVALVPLAGFSLFTTREMRDALVTAEQERQLRQADGVAQHLDAFLDQAGREAQKLGQAMPAVGTAERAYLVGVLDDTILLARWRPVDGAPETAVRPDAVLPVAFEERLAASARALLESGNTQAPLVDGPEALGPERQLVVAVTAPVSSHGQVVGVFQEVAALQPAWGEAARNVPPPSRLMLLRPDGSVVAGNGTLDAITDRAVASRAIVQQFLAARGRSRGSRSYTVSDRDGTRAVLGSFAATGHGWGVFVEVDERLALAPVAHLTRMLTWGGALAAVLAMGAALLLGSLISRPMARLAHISKRLADGDFSVLAERSRLAELDEVGLNFNRMATRLGALVEKFRAAAREANDMFLGTIRALAEAIDEKDPYTKGHSVRVNRYAVIIGRYLGLSREEMRHLQISSLLHDVGKIGIDDAILKKPAALSPDEFQVMKTHPERGAKIMGRIPQMRNVLSGMRFHHERFGGGGYPLGLSREEIPLQARIVAVADTFDAMITDRPYQKAMTIEQAVVRINDLRGTHLDPQVVAAFNRAYEAGEFEDALLPPPSEPPSASAPEPEPAMASAETRTTGPQLSRVSGPIPVSRES